MLAVAGGKGGCGKTTTALGLAAALVRQRKSAVVADADREMPNLHAMAGVSREPGLDAVAEGWPARMVAGVADPPTPGVEILPAATGPPTGGVVNPSNPRVASPPNARSSESPNTGATQSPNSPRSSARSALARLRGTADAVLLDCPAGAGPDAAAPLRVADAALIVTSAEPACLRDAAKTAAMARELGASVAGAVVSRAAEVPEGVTQLLDCPLVGVVPDAGTRAEPLADDRVRAAHDRLLSTLQPQCL